MPGSYAVWVRYHKLSTDCSAFYMLLRDEDGEAVAYLRCDFVPLMPTETPWRAVQTPATGFVWERMDVTIERPMDGRLSFGGYIHRGGYAPRQVDCVLVSNEPGLLPRQLDATTLAAVPEGPPAVAATPARAGLTPSGGTPAVSVFCSITDPDKQFHAGLIHCGSAFIDHAQALQFGFNRDHTGGPAYGVRTLATVEAFTDASKEFTEKHPAPEGRFVNADGQVGAMWSLSFSPLQGELAGLLQERVKQAVDRDDVECWRICGETGGWLDYSQSSIEAFRRWLEQEHGTITTLNERWGSSYGSFAEITPPKTFDDGRACWLEFRDFCSTVFCEAVGRQLPIIRDLDPKKRPCIGQNSNLDLLAPYFTSMRPMDWEQYIDVALAGERYVGWDVYSADDYLGCETDLLQSISGGRELLTEEWNPHATDPRIMARSFWTQIGKGARGVYAFMFHEGTGHDSYPKWALVRADLTPKDKMGALSDATHEVHRIEPLLMGSKPVHAVKPVALYYSRMDLSLGQPHLSLWADSADSPYHVYEALRGLGYAVRWITPRQVTAGELSQVGAVVMVDCHTR